MFHLHRIAQSIDLLLACYVANTACAIIVIVTSLIFIIVSPSHAFLLVVLIHMFCHTLVAVEALLCFQHTPAVQSNDFVQPGMLLVIFPCQMPRPSSSTPIHLEKIIASHHSSRNALRASELCSPLPANCSSVSFNRQAVLAVMNIKIHDR